MAITEKNLCTQASALFAELPEGSLRLLQLTDCHLFADADATLMGINCRQSLNNVIQMVRNEMPVDAVLATGDLVHDGTADGYQQLIKELSLLSSPVYCLPGNHDDVEMMLSVLNQAPVHCQKTLQLNNWLLIMLDSTVAGSASGNLADIELELLEKTLTTNPDKHILICMHHNPVAVNSRWLDTMMVQNADTFFQITDRFENVRGILWGHVHQQFDDERNQVRLMASPSTSVQFEKFGNDFSTEALAPGCRWLALLPDGHIRSVVSRTDQLPAGLDINSNDY